ncbi:MAG TPA: hypothetical protein VHU84_02515, partial [Lacipirellulaceae bacterium]|nr:hypothetical protein [Lacipirellulaceae bacterium]
MDRSIDADRGLVSALVDDGRPLIKLTGLALIGSGLFAFFLAASGHFLPHDIAFLGMDSGELRAIADGRLVYFMMHDRVSFGGAILGVGTLYLWLAEFPLRARQAWAWWTLAASGAVGFASFLTYLGYGYLDTWHGMATVSLLPLFIWGMIRSYSLVRPMPAMMATFLPGSKTDLRTAYGVGRALLLVTSWCLVLGGAIIMTVGMTRVFVPQDLEFMRICAEDVQAVNAHLMPLIAHDRAGFGGGVCCCGLTMFFCIYCGLPSRGLWQALAVT